MDFALPEDLALFQATLRRFVNTELIPFEGESIDDGRIKPEFHARVSAKAREAGLWLLDVPEKFGGQGLGLLGLSIFWEEISRTTALPARDITVFGPAVGPILLTLTGEKAEQYLKPVLEGRKRVCFAQTEPEAGSDPARMQTRAIRDGDFYVISGSKRFITDADLADIAQVMAVTTPELGARGISCFIVDMKSPGVRLGRRQKTMMGERPSEITFDEVRVPAGNLVGGEGNGFKLAQGWITYGRIRHAARACGVSERCLELAAAYAKQRKTFGALLADRQSIQWMLADSYTDIHATRLMMRQAAWLVELGQQARVESYMVKMFGDEMSFRVADRCMQIHGALGTTPDLPIEQFWRDQRGYLITEGPSEVMRMQIAKHVLANYG
jgi:acyl-CoA dehydrogenase